MKGLSPPSFSETPRALEVVGQNRGVSQLWPDPLAGAPWATRSLAVLALGVAAREVADCARALVPRDPHGGGVLDGRLLLQVLRLGQLVTAVTEAAVVLERADGTPWSIIDQVLGATPAQLQDRDGGPSGWRAVVETWQHQVEWASLPSREPDLDLPEVLTQSADDIARELDAWLDGQGPAALTGGTTDGGDGGADAGAATGPISAAMELMNPLAELMHRQGQRERLLDRLRLVAPLEQLLLILEREALLHDALARNPDYDASENAADAAHVRALVAGLRAQIHETRSGDGGVSDKD